MLQRIAVKDKQFIELTPIEVAVDEMQNRVAELEDVVLPPIDVKKLQLRLQGSVAVQVNAGPLAYATVFLEPQRSLQYPSDKVEDLKEVFRFEYKKKSKTKRIDFYNRLRFFFCIFAESSLASVTRPYK